MSKDADYSEFLQKKHRIFFRYLDRNSDGILYRHDLAQRVDKMASLNVINEEESAYTRSCWMKWCDKVFPSIDMEKGVTEDQFVEMHRNFKTSGQWAEYVDTTRGIYNALFDRLDANRDGKVSREELKIYYKSLGAADDRFIDKVFRKLDLNQDGELVKSEFVKAGMMFWNSEDQSDGYEIMYDVHN